MVIEDFQKRNSLLLKTHELLNSSIFGETLQGTNTKESLEKYVQRIDKYEALHKNFIKFGNKVATKFCIIDIDNCNMSLELYAKDVFKILGFNPTWILRSTKGFHVGFILSQSIFNDNLTDKNKLSAIKSTLTMLLKADANGSLRHFGYWRNPLTHKSILNPVTFNIDDLENKIKNIFINRKYYSKTIDNKVSNKKDFREGNRNNFDNINKKDFVKGNRNNFLFMTIVKLLYAGKIKNKDILYTLTKLNANELNANELNSIFNSVKKYNITPNFEHQKVDRIKRGEFSNLLFQNKIHSFRVKNRIILERQRAGQKIAVAKKKVNTTMLIYKAHIEIFKQHKRATNKTISKLSKRSIRTIQRYNHIKKILIIKAFKEYVREVIEGGDLRVFRANVAPLEIILNKVLEETFFQSIGTGKLYKFKVTCKLVLVIEELVNNE